MYTPINGYTKEKIISAIQTRMLDHPSVNMFGIPIFCTSDGNHCVWGCFFPEGKFTTPFDSFAPLPANAMASLQGLHDRRCNMDYSDRRPRLIKWVEENVE